MRKYLVALVGIVVAVSLAGMAYAGTAKLEEKTTTTKEGVTTTEKGTVKTQAGKETLKEKTTYTKEGKETEALVKYQPKKGLKETVTFKQFTDPTGSTMIVIKDNKEVRLQTRHAKNWKNNIIGKEKRQITIWSSYDPSQVKYVTHAE